MDSKHFKTDKNRQIEKMKKQITQLGLLLLFLFLFFFSNMALCLVQLHVAIGHLTEFSQVCVCKCGHGVKMKERIKKHSL